MGTAALALAPGLASAATQAPAGHTLAPNTRFYLPPPAQGSVQQILQLVKSGQLKNAGLIAAMESVPSAVWLDGETAAQAAEPGNQGSQQADADVARQVRLTLAAARLENAVPIFVAYNIPGRDCSQYSAGGAPTDADYDAWINAIGGALGNAKAVVLEEPDSLADLPGYCGAAYAAEFPGITNTTRVGDVALRGLDAGGGPEHQPLPRRREQRLAERRRHGRDADRGGRPAVAGLLPQRLQLPVRHQQRLLRHLGVGVHRLRDRERGPDPGRRAGRRRRLLGNVHAGRRLRLPGLPADHAARRLRDPVLERRRPRNQHRHPGRRLHRRRAEPVRRLERDLAPPPTSTPPASTPATPAPSAGTVPTTHFIVDTSRNGLGPDSMQSYAAAPDDQPASVISSLQAGNWCNPPSAGLGLKPTANAGVSLSSLDSYLPSSPPLLDAYLWVKTPGQSDGQCDAAGGVRSLGRRGRHSVHRGLAERLERVLPDLRPALEPGDQLAPDRPGRRRLVLPAGPHPRPEREPGPAALM